jgi:ribosomal protein S18 acetylase RimI-like enzyme
MEMTNLTNDVPLDNPIWNSLTSGHSGLATGAGVGGDMARRYPGDIGPLAGLREPTPEAWADLAELVPESDVAVLFLEEPPQPPAGWDLLLGGSLVQMVCRARPVPTSLAEPAAALGAADVREMFALAKLADPGPFREHTAGLGGFFGVRVDGRLAAMAGRRLLPAGFAEVSAVCTHPDFRGRGFARAVVEASASAIFDSGRTPFLTCLEANTGAIRVYEQVGFVLRRKFHLAVLKRPPHAKR